ncbi:MAG: ABC transporter ATP-binding protein [Bacilli bacterium]|nr:ABC transporter ATP-binding protein [Bacilli bacterium]
MPKVEFSHVNAYYFRSRKERTQALFDCSMTLESGKTTVLLGPSGAGKSTILKIVTDSVPYEGDITLDGVDIESKPLQERDLSYVSQSYALYPMMTVFDNIAFPLKNRGAKSDEVKERVYEIAEELGITFLLSRKPYALSGGQQQKVALARALVKKPSLLLLDEPLSNLDPESKEEAKHFVKQILSSMKLTSIYVTHDLMEASFLGDKIVVIDEGKVVFQGTPIEFADSTNPTVKAMLEAYHGQR